MSCNNFGTFNPYGWLCNTFESIGAGFSSGLSSGVGTGAADAIEKIVKAVSDVLSEAANGISGEVAARALNKFGKGLFNNLDLMGDATAGDLAKKISAGVNDFLANLNLSTGGVSAGSIGSNINVAFSDFLKHTDIPDMTRKVAEDFSEAFKNGFEGINLKGNVQHASDEILPAVEKFFESFRTITIGEADKFRDEFQQVFANMSRDWAIKNVPWLALGITVLTSAPLLAWYGYYKIKHNIGRPKLIQETKNYNLLDQVYSAAISTRDLAWNNMKTFTKWSAASFASAFGISTVLGIGLGIASIIGKGLNNGPPESNFATEFVSDTFCHIFDKVRYCNYKDNLFSFSNVGLACLGIGVAAVAYQNAKSLYNYAQNFWVPRVKPIFNNKIQTVMDDIVNTTKNLHNHGGYFQNLLLYGPGGTGKTMIAKYIARNSGLNYVMMSGGDLAQYIKRGEHVTELNKLFENAKSAAGPTIIFIDEAESLCMDRSKMDRSELFELINAFLNHTGEQSKKVMVVLATNRMEDIDPAVLTRMDRKIHILPPEDSERKEIIKLYLPQFFSSKEIGQFFNEDDLNKISKETEGLTGRAIFKMLNALSCRKKSTRENLLTLEMRDSVIKDFVEQEKEVVAQLDASKTMAKVALVR